MCNRMFRAAPMSRTHLAQLCQHAVGGGERASTRTVTSSVEPPTGPLAPPKHQSRRTRILMGSSVQTNPPTLAIGKEGVIGCCALAEAGATDKSQRFRRRSTPRWKPQMFRREVHPKITNDNKKKRGEHSSDDSSDGEDLEAQWLGQSQRSNTIAQIKSVLGGLLRPSRVTIIEDAKPAGWKLAVIAPGWANTNVHQLELERVRLRPDRSQTASHPLGTQPWLPGSGRNVQQRRSFSGQTEQYICHPK